MSEENDYKRNIFLYVLIAGVLISIATSFYFFYLKKDYDFIVETECNPEMEVCFFRDCENSLDGCPPNNLSYYNEYTIKAKDFSSCKDEDCSDACLNNTIECVKTECSDNDILERSCVGLASINMQN